MVSAPAVARRPHSARATVTAPALGPRPQSARLLRRQIQEAEEQVSALVAEEQLKRAIGVLDPNEIETAIGRAQCSGVERRKLAAAKTLLSQLRNDDASRQVERAYADGNVAVLLEAITVGQRVGVSKRLLEQATARAAMLVEEPRKLLREMCRGTDEDALQDAIVSARMKGLKGKELAPAERRHSELVRLSRARRNLDIAVGDRDVEALSVALEEAKRAGLERHRVVDAEDLMMQLRRCAASETLCRAIGHKDVDALGQAVACVRDSGVALRRARFDYTPAPARCLRVEEAEEALSQLIEEPRRMLKDVMDSRDAKVLRAAIRRAKLHEEFVKKRWN